MMGLIFRGTAAILVLLILIAFIKNSLVTPVVPPQAASVALAGLPNLGSPSPDANAFTGTLTYGRDNAGNQVPYFVYASPTGTAATKALVFNSDSTCMTSDATFPCLLIKNALSTYYASNRVRATGNLKQENLVVDKLSIVTQ